ncbi:hypothetical protein [Natrarchaeobius chitinivorans]|uniref:Uncharacterized protein n=1 Tax=Natrarchaeobius chitinivorans TaxID=1679083 RepID=A0A3N6M1K6_NATCH|nr:hypothetical protein [Natrarchaeobius chitinivorans]RQG97218.1 hypothetical protein EA473_03870 [Natrarchaeobius chitinivorans]
MTSSDRDATTVILMLVFTILLAVAALFPAYFVWLTAPPVGGEFFPYIRATAAVIAAIVGAFLGAYIMQSSVSIARDLSGNDGDGDDG